MLKALLLECIRPYIEEKYPSNAKWVVYFFTITALSLLISANYVYYFLPDNPNVIILIGSATISLIVAVFIEILRCYLRSRSKYKTLNSLKASSKELVEIATTKASNIVDRGSKIIRYLPLIIRLVHTSVLTLIMCKIIKRFITLSISKKNKVMI